MKKLILILGITIVAFTACDKIDDLNTKEISDVEISKTVLIKADLIKSSQAKSSQTEVPFIKTLTLDLNDISEIKSYLSHLENMDIKSFTCEISDLGEGLISVFRVSIPALKLTVPITSIQTNKTLKVNFTSEQLKKIAKILLEDKSIEIILSGNVEQAVNFSIKTTALADIEVEIL